MSDEASRIVLALSILPPPADADDLTQLEGIDADAATHLNSVGIYKFDQLKNLNAKQKTLLSSKLPLEDANFGQWQRSISLANLPVAAIKLSDEERAKFNSNFGVLYSSPPEDADDLTRLAGIDKAAAARLNAAGIYKFDQLTNLDDKQEALLASHLKLDDADADFADWRRCMYAWGRGIDTTAEADESYEAGLIHGIELPQIADGIFDGEKLIAYPEQVIFRGSNPEGWGRESANRSKASKHRSVVILFAAISTTFASAASTHVSPSSFR